MPRSRDNLSALQVKAARYEGKAYKLFDGGGLFLHITKSGLYWRMKYRFEGREKLYALGVYPKVTLKKARQGRDEARQLLDQQIDPGAQRQAKKAAKSQATKNAFELVAREWWEQVHRKSVVPAHAGRNLRRMELHLFPPLGSVPIGQITAPQLLKALRKVEQTGHLETAHRVRTLAGQVFRYAIATGRAERDLAQDLRDALPHASPRHRPALVDPQKLAPLLQAIEGYAGQPTTMAALRLAPILFMRPGELRKARWEHIDLEDAAWDFRPSKGGYPLVIPLPRQVVGILRELEKLTGPTGYVFPSVRSKDRPMSDNTLGAALNQLGYQRIQSAHGFRATARTVLVEQLGYPIEVVEMQLGHAVRDALGRAYNRTTYLDQRRQMLQAWADYLDGLRDGGA